MPIATMHNRTYYVTNRKAHGARRFDEILTPCEVMGEEDRTVEYVHQAVTEERLPGGGVQNHYGEPETRTRVEKWLRIRIGRREKWVKASKVRQ